MILKPKINILHIINSKLPNVGTSIFTEISAEAEKYNAINLAQGFPNFDCDPILKSLVAKYLDEGKNQYAPMAGLLSLRIEIANKMITHNGIEVDAQNEITITAGATQALFTAIAAFVSPGDEVVVIEPAYDSYVPAIKTMGGIPIFLTTLPPNFEIDFDSLQKLITTKTRMIIINTPGNPSTKIWTKADFEKLAKIVEDTNIIILSDEVYEHLTFDENKHYSALNLPTLKDRTVSVFSFGKTFHNTGWKVGYAVASEALMIEFRKVHQFNVFCVNSFVQYGLSEYLSLSSAWKNLPTFYQEKRDLLSSEMNGSGFTEIKSEGSFFTLFDYSEISKEHDQIFVKRVIIENGVAAIPLSSFYYRPISHLNYIRLCFAKNEETIIEGARRLRSIRFD